MVRVSVSVTPPHSKTAQETFQAAQEKKRQEENTIIQQLWHEFKDAIKTVGIDLASTAAGTAAGVVVPYGKLVVGPLVTEGVSRVLHRALDEKEMKAEVIRNTVRLGLKPEDVRNILRSERIRDEKELKKLYETTQKVVHLLEKKETESDWEAGLKLLDACGQTFRSKELQATVAVARTMFAFHGAVTAFKGPLQFAAIASPVAGLLTCFSSLAAILSGFDGTELILKKLEHLFEHLEGMEKRQYEQFAQLVATQVKIMQTMRQSFQCLGKQMENGFSDTRREMQLHFTQLQANVDVLLDIFQKNTEAQLVAPITFNCGLAESWLAGTGAGKKEKEVPKLKQNLAVFAQTSSLVSTLTGLSLFEACRGNYQPIYRHFHSLDDKKLNLWIGFLHRYVVNRLGWWFQSPVPNPMVWGCAVDKCVALMHAFPDVQVDAERAKPMKAIGELALAFIHAISADKHVWAALVADYYRSLTSLQQAIEAEAREFTKRFLERSHTKAIATLSFLDAPQAWLSSFDTVKIHKIKDDEITTVANVGHYVTPSWSQFQVGPPFQPDQTLNGMYTGPQHIVDIGTRQGTVAIPAMPRLTSVKPLSNLSVPNVYLLAHYLGELEFQVEQAEPLRGLRIINLLPILRNNCQSSLLQFEHLHPDLHSLTRWELPLKISTLFQSRKTEIAKFAVQGTWEGLPDICVESRHVLFALIRNHHPNHDAACCGHDYQGSGLAKYTGHLVDHVRSCWENGKTESVRDVRLLNDDHQGQMMSAMDSFFAQKREEFFTAMVNEGKLESAFEQLDFHRDLLHNLLRLAGKQIMGSNFAKLPDAKSIKAHLTGYRGGPFDLAILMAPERPTDFQLPASDSTTLTPLHPLRLLEGSLNSLELIIKKQQLKEIEAGKSDSCCSICVLL